MRLMNPVTDPPGAVHEHCIGFAAIYDILYVCTNIARQIVVEECADISVLHM